MEKNHDLKKASSLSEIRKKCGTVLIFAIAGLIFELISRPCRILYTVLMQRKMAASGEINLMDYLAATQFGSLPVQICRALLMIPSVIILIVLFARIRKSESPFQEKHGKTLQIIAVMQGIIPFISFAEQVILLAQDRMLCSERLLPLFSPTFFSYWLLANAVLLFFLGWFIRYGAFLQQESDETL